MKRISRRRHLESVIPRSSKPAITRSVVMLAFPDAQILDIAGPLEVFSRASRWLIDEGISRLPSYEVALVAAARGSLPMSSGLKFVVETSIEDVKRPIDTLMVAGGKERRLPCATTGSSRGYGRWRHEFGGLCSVCTGTFLLAQAGLLEGRSATTHWHSCELLQRQFPGIKVETDPIFVRDGGVYTSAGVTAGIDLALARVEEDHGRQVALGVARELVMFLRRPGGQSQFSVQLSTQSTDREPLRDLQV
jgi:transcriptional regulator GlxA family with amidase domain